ncbi:MAG TPA: mannosyltransferase family protein [Solirubrobacteraceae bacterium]|nr:mannosyltransferase family protein [Solirubrobacteraceae bacterium]
MNSNAAEPAIADTASVPGAPVEHALKPRGVAGRLRARLGRLRADEARMTAVRDSWLALWTSRVFVWAVGVGTVATLGFGPARTALDPPGITRGFGWLGDLLAAPVARWDSAWYLVIARYGYRPDLTPFTSPRTAFFPLYPLGVRIIGWTGVPLILAGVLLSLAAFGLALYGIHRLASLELSRSARSVTRGRSADAARLAVLVMALSPMAFYFSAVYSESLYLALSVGLFWSARNGRWAWVGVLGALAGATRSTGLVLMLPAAIIYLYGPREDRPPDLAVARARSSRVASGGPLSGARMRGLLAALRPRYRLRRDVLWLALMPAGVVVYCTWLALSGGEALGPYHAAAAWDRHLVGPFVGVWDGATAAFDGARQLLSFQRAHVYFPLAGGDPFVAAWHNLFTLAFLAAAVPAIIGVLRRLPLAYGAYAIAALVLPLSDPVAPEPLQSIPRYLVVLFPLGIWMGSWLAEHPRAQRPALAVSALVMAFFLAEFATWHWVA